MTRKKYLLLIYCSSLLLRFSEFVLGYVCIFKFSNTFIGLNQVLIQN